MQHNRIKVTRFHCDALPSLSFLSSATDFATYCTGPIDTSLTAASCLGWCGGQAPSGCRCDPYCDTHPTGCCTDYTSTCVNTNKCSNKCSGNSPDGSCTCGDTCAERGTCCSDAPGPCGSFYSPQCSDIVVQHGNYESDAIADGTTPAGWTLQRQWTPLAQAISVVAGNAAKPGAPFNNATNRYFRLTVGGATADGNYLSNALSARTFFPFDKAVGANKPIVAGSQLVFDVMVELNGRTANVHLLETR